MSGDRFRKKKVVGSLKELPNLIKDAQGENMQKPAAVEVSSAIQHTVDATVTDTDDSLIMALKRAMCLGETFTAAEATKVIVGEYTVAEVEVMLNVMANTGMVSKTLVKATDLKKTTTAYQLKEHLREKTMPKARVGKFLAGGTIQCISAAAAEQSAPPAVADGMDCVIWKCAQDNKYRTHKQLQELVAAVGFDAKAARNRINTLVRHNWFDTNLNKCPPQISMKKGVKYPYVEKTQMEETVATFSNDSVQAAEANASAKVINVIAPVINRNAIGHATGTVPPDNGHRGVHYALSADDHINMSIWKVMQDGKPYTTADVVLLCSDIGLTEKNISPRMSVLYAKGWFTRTGDKRGFVYTMKPGTPAPAEMRKRRKSTVDAQLQLIGTQSEVKDDSKKKLADAATAFIMSVLANGPVLSSDLASAVAHAGFTEEIIDFTDGSALSGIHSRAVDPSGKDTRCVWYLAGTPMEKLLNVIKNAKQSVVTTKAKPFVSAPVTPVKTQANVKQEKLEIAKAFLTEILSGGPVGVNVIHTAARKNAVGFAKLERAKRELGVQSATAISGTVWCFPNDNVPALSVVGGTDTITLAARQNVVQKAINASAGSDEVELVKTVITINGTLFSYENAVALLGVGKLVEKAKETPDLLKLITVVKGVQFSLEEAEKFTHALMTVSKEVINVRVPPNAVTDKFAVVKVPVLFLNGEEILSKEGLDILGMMQHLGFGK